MKHNPLVPLVTGGLTQSPKRRRAAELLAMMDRPCEALLAGGQQCQHEGRHRRGSRWVCGQHDHAGVRYMGGAA